MSEETVLIQATHGPYAGSQITVPADVAAQAIADGWAIDPYAQPPAEAKEYTEEDTLAATEAANEAAAVMRGEAPAPKKGKKSETQAAAPAVAAAEAEAKKSKPEDPLKRSLEAEARPSGSYDTRSTKK